MLPKCAGPLEELCCRRTGAAESQRTAFRGAATAIGCKAVSFAGTAVREDRRGGEGGSTASPASRLSSPTTVGRRSGCSWRSRSGHVSPGSAGAMSMLSDGEPVMSTGSLNVTGTWMLSRPPYVLAAPVLEGRDQCGSAQTCGCRAIVGVERVRRGQVRRLPSGNRPQPAGAGAERRSVLGRWIVSWVGCPVSSVRGSGHPRRSRALMGGCVSCRQRTALFARTYGRRVVEAAGVEPASESTAQQDSTCVAALENLASRRRRTAETAGSQPRIVSSGRVGAARTDQPAE